jgi:hypothetical protein
MSLTYTIPASRPTAWIRAISSRRSGSCGVQHGSLAQPASLRRRSGRRQAPPGRPRWTRARSAWTDSPDSTQDMQLAPHVGQVPRTFRRHATNCRVGLIARLSNLRNLWRFDRTQRGLRCTIRRTLWRPVTDSQRILGTDSSILYVCDSRLLLTAWGCGYAGVVVSSLPRRPHNPAQSAGRRQRKIATWCLCF